MPEEVFAEQKSTDWIKIILTAVSGFVLLAGSAYAGYYYGTQQVQPAKEPTPAVSQPTPKPTPTPEPTIPPVIDPTANWETYTNEKYLYEIKYPKEWVLRPKEQAPDQIVRFVRDSFVGDHCELGVYGGDSSRGVSEEKKPVEVKTVTIGGVTATKEIYADPFDLGTVFWRIKFPEGSIVNQIAAQYNIDDGVCLETLNAVLSTFKFLD